MLAGVPGLEAHDAGASTGRYPAAAVDLSKLLKERGIPVTFQHERMHREYVSLHSADFWVPVLAVSSSVLVAAGGNLLSDLIRCLIGHGEPRASTQLHVQYRIVSSDGSDHTLDADGDAETVLGVIDSFEDTWRDRNANSD